MAEPFLSPSYDTYSYRAALTQSRPLLWRELAKSVPGRSNKDCRRRWWNSLAVGIAKGPWSEGEDERLIKAVFKHGFSWNQVAQAVMSRNPDQCSSHWSQVLDPGINHYDWTPTEDLQLLHAVLTHGTNWAAISSSHIPMRTAIALKNRYSTLRLCDEHNSSKPKKQIAATTSNISPIGSLGATTMQGSPMSEARKSPDIQGHDSDKIAGGDDGEEDDEDDEDDEDEDENIENGFRGYGDEDESRASHSQYIGKPNNHARRLDLKSTRRRAQDEFAERGGDGILLNTNSLHYDRVAPLPTPTATETWTTETADDMSSDKNIFLSSNPQSPPLDLPSDYSRFFGAVQEPGATPTHVSYTPYSKHIHPYTRRDKVRLDEMLIDTQTLMP